MKKRSHFPAIYLLLLLFLLLMWGVLPLSFTADESSYISGGYALWAEGRDALPLLAQRGYPPLLPVIQTTLLYFSHPDIPVESLNGWPTQFEVFTQTLSPYLEPQVRTRLVTRIATVWLTLILGATVYRWARSVGTERSGLLALIFLTLDPNILAHGRLATTDIGITALGTLSLLIIWTWQRRSNWTKTIFAGFMLGLVLLAKLSGLFWVAAAGISIIISLLSKKREHLPQLWFQAVTIFCIAFLILWGGYGFTIGEIDGLPFHVPAPDYWNAVRYLLEYETNTFLFGEIHNSHTMWFFPLTALIKNPLPLLLGSISGIWLLFRFRKKTSTNKTIKGLSGLMLFCVVYVSVAVFSRMNIGYRHLLPIQPLLHLLTAYAITVFLDYAGIQKLSRFLIACSIGWYAIGTLRLTPFELAYFNELIGGPAQGYRYLADSSLAWGQTSDALDLYLENHPDVKASPPKHKYHPEAGKYAINASYLHGVGTSDPYNYEWFRHQIPVDNLRYSVLLYDGPRTQQTFVAKCTPPEGHQRAALLTEEEITTGVGVNIRSVSFACDQAWLYPGADQPGIYALGFARIKPASGLCQTATPPCPPSIRDSFISRHLELSRYSFSCPDCRPQYVLYESPGLALPNFTSKHLAQPSEQSYPVELTGPLNLLGILVYQNEDELEVETWWRVTSDVITRPFSIMGHLGNLSKPGDGKVLVTADGAGVWPPTLLSGDVFVQLHRYPINDEYSDLWFRTGVYWTDTMERWQCQKGTCDSILVSIP